MASSGTARCAAMNLDLAGRDARLARLLQQPERFAALKRGMAHFLAGVMSLKDAGVRKSRDRESGEPINVVEPTLSGRELARRPSLAKMFLDRGGYMPTMQSLQDERETQQLMDNVRSTRRMEFRMTTTTTADGRLVLLAPFVKWNAFHCSFQLPRGESQEPASIGGMRHRLVEHVQSEVEEWLELVADRLARSGVAASEPAELQRVICVIANKVARRITLADTPAAPDTPELRAAALRDFAELEGEVPDRRCVDCLGVAIDLAKAGTRVFDRVADAAAVRRCVDKVVLSMAPQVGFVGMNADRADLEQLYDAVQHRDPERMWAALDVWQDAAGAYAYLAFLDVLFCLTNGDQLAEHRQVLRLAQPREGGEAEAEAEAAPPLLLPPPNFCAPLETFVFDRGRIGDVPNARVLTLVAAQLLYTPGAFERGVVSRRATYEAYTEAVQESAAALGQMSARTEHLRIGLPLREFLQQVLDRTSFNYSDVLKSMCSLSGFSIQEIFDVFHIQSPLYLQMESEFQTMTSALMTVPLPRDHYGVVYRGFARDGLVYGLPLLFNERQACGVSPVQPTTALFDLVNTVGKHRFAVAQNSMWISTRAAAAGHSGLRPLLDRLVAAGRLTKSRPWVVDDAGRRVRHSCVVYQVPFALLWQPL